MKITKKSLRNKIIVDKDMRNSEYQGMNYYANKELGTGYDMRKNELYVDKNLKSAERQKTICHECIESELMKHGMKYKKADRLATKGDSK